MEKYKACSVEGPGGNLNQPCAGLEVHVRGNEVKVNRSTDYSQQVGSWSPQKRSHSCPSVPIYIL